MGKTPRLPASAALAGCRNQPCTALAPPSTASTCPVMCLNRRCHRQSGCVGHSRSGAIAITALPSASGSTSRLCPQLRQRIAAFPADHYLISTRYNQYHFPSRDVLFNLVSANREAPPYRLQPMAHFRPIRQRASFNGPRSPMNTLSTSWTRRSLGEHLYG